MKIAGIIAEYNPFHNGHAFQLHQVRRECDAAVAVMSGSVVQRGSIAYFDKFIRARAAVASGLDLVIELPCVYTLAPAELFARGAVSMLDSLGVINKLYFGAECGDTRSLSRAADIMSDETPAVSLKIKENLKTGMSYRAAQLAAYVGLVPSELLNQPNNILGIEYIKALKSSKSSIVPKALLREFANHNDTSPSNGYASGNAIRDILDLDGNIAPYVPKKALDLYGAARHINKTMLDAVVMYMLRIRGMSVFNNVFDAPPDMVARILHSVPESNTFDDIIAFAHTRQFSNARVRRAILSALLEIDGTLVNMSPQYIRVLAFNDRGREILNEIEKKTKLPIITKVADYKENSPMFAAEIRATELSSICRGFRRGLDFIQSPAYVEQASKTSLRKAPARAKPKSPAKKAAQEKSKTEQ